jgi:Ca2+-binding RTX toxin-like protein
MLTATEITSLYLFGTKTPPSNLIDDALIRAAGIKTETSVNINEYMTEGPGRFANPAFFDEVKLFFSGAISLPPGSYSEAEIRPLLGTNQAIIAERSWAYDDGNGDYGERTYIWNSVAFEIDDSARFVVAPNGDRYIENFAVIPYSVSGHENFDFSSDDPIATAGNGSLQDNVDPSRIGRVVDIGFTGERVKVTYTLADYQRDASNAVPANPFLLLALPSAINDVVQGMWEGGTIRFLDEQGRPIIYGTNGADQLDPKIAERSKYLSGALARGLVVVAGDGNDSVTGTQVNDKLYGGKGQDSLSGESGDDELYGGGTDGADDGVKDTMKGGAGFDTYHVGVNDIIQDSDGKGKLLSGSSELQGGREQGKDDGSACGTPVHRSDSEKIYKDDAGNTYQKSGADLTITLAAGGTVTVENWHDGDLGITLKPRDASGGGAIPCFPPQRNTSPLVVDLDGDGVEVTQLRQNSAFFDVDGDGIRERTAWVSSDDGLLALDRNGNGKIDDVSELFGYGRTISTLRIDTTWTSGFDALSVLDSVRDYILDSNDTAFSDLRVWRDLNQDGQSSSDELFSLTDVGIKSIDLRATSVSEQDGGNFISDRSTVQFMDGAIRSIEDVWFEFDQQSTQSDQIVVDAEAAAFPTLRGAGALKDLRSAAAEDPTLKELLRDFAAVSPSDVSSVMSKVDRIIQHWAGADDVAVNSRGAYADARHMAVYEALTDTVFLQAGDRIPLPYAGAEVEEDYQLYLRNAAARLFMQTDTGKALIPELSVDDGFFLNLVDGTSSATLLARLADKAPAGEIDRIGYWNTIFRVLDAVYESFADVNAAGDGGAAYKASVQELLSAQGIDLTYQEIVNAQVGSAGDDRFVTKSVWFRISELSACLVVGGAGNDDIRLGGRQQIIYWGAGQGNDVVVGAPLSYAGFDLTPRIQFRLSGLSADDITIARGPEALSSDVVITITATGETLTLRDAVNVATLQNALVFDDGTSVSIFEATPEASLIPLQATDGDDRLEDLLGQNRLNGGAGNDVLIGRRGDDSYLFGRGSGRDIVVEDIEGGTNDEIIFGENITADDLVIARSGLRGEDLIIGIAGTEDEIVIADQFRSNAPRVESFVLPDGTVLDAGMIREFVTGVPDDTGRVLGFDASSDILYISGPGATFSGLNGNDTYVITDATGSFTIADNSRDSGQTDTVYFEADLANVVIRRTSPDLFEFSLVQDQQVAIDMSAGGIESFQFYDRTLDFAGMVAEINRREQLSGAADITGTSANDILAGSDLADTIHGLDGHDVIEGLAGDDIIDGGSGNDWLAGGAGDDIIIDEYGTTTIQFNLGDGQDIVLNGETFNNESRIVFGDGIAPEDLHYSFELIDATQYSDYYAFANGQYGLRVTLGEGGDSLLLVGSAFASDVSGFVGFDFVGGARLAISDVLVGLRSPTDADQLIVGSNSHDVLAGGRGDDILVSGIGGSGYTGQPDEFDYDLGDGRDIIVGSASTGSLIRFGAGLTPDQIAISRSGENKQDLVFTVLSTGETLTVRDQYTDFAVSQRDADYNLTGHYLTSSFIEVVRFADGTVWSSADLLSRTLVATAGDDEIIGSSAADTMDGGAGNDLLEGGAGSDVYLFGRGSGQDTIVESSRSIDFPFADDSPDMVEGLRDIDELRFNDGVTLADLDIIVAGVDQGDLLIRIRGTSDSVLIRHQVNDGGNWGEIGADEWAADYADEFGPEPVFAAGVERFVFADGTVYDRNDFLAAVTARDNAGANEIVTSDAGGILDGGAGDDRLLGGAGNDNYIFASGYGEDTVVDQGGDDVLRLGAGIDPNFVGLTRTGENGDDLLLEVDGEQRLAITIEGQFGSASHRIEALEFEDGTRWTWQQIQSAILSASISEQGDQVAGFATAEVIRTRGGDDVIRTGGGADFVDGGAGWDVVLFDGPEGRYQVENRGTSIVVSDMLAGGQQTTLTNVEEIRFLGDPEAGNDDQSVVFGQNSPPVAHDLTFAATEDIVLRLAAGGLVAGASDPDGGALELVEVKDSVNGSVAVDSHGFVVFTPDEDFFGDASFIYKVRDASGLMAEATAFINFAGVNDAPVAARTSFSAASDEDAFLSVTLPADTFSDIDNPSLEVLATLSDGTALPDWLAFDPVTWTFAGQPPEDFSGNIAIAVSASDGSASASTSVILTISPVNDAPLAQPDTGSAGENETKVFDLLANDTDIDFDDTMALVSASVRSVSGIVGLTPDAAQAAFSIEGDNLAFTPGALFDPLNVGEQAAVVVDYDIVDAAGAHSSSSFTLTVDGAEDQSNIQYGTTGADSLTGTADADVIDAMAGDDFVFAGNGADTVYGREGFDQLHGEAGDDYLIGGSGNDFLYGGEGNDLLEGGADDDQLFAGGGNDHLLGGDGNDLLYAESGDNTLEGGAGADTLYGASGNDVLLGDDGNDTIFGNGGTDSLYGGDGDDQLYGSSGNDLIDGGNDNDMIYGNGGLDQLFGGGGNDQIYGGEASDVVSDGAGDDIVYANGGADTLFAGAGNDNFWGGSGNDTFVFNATIGQDVINDFTTEDVVEFRDGAFADWADLLGSASQSGADTVITVDAANSVTLKNVALSSLNESQFQFS